MSNKLFAALILPFIGIGGILIGYAIGYGVAYKPPVPPVPVKPVIFEMIADCEHSIYMIGADTSGKYVIAGADRPNTKEDMNYLAWVYKNLPLQDRYYIHLCKKDGDAT